MQQSLLSRTTFFCLLMLACLGAHSQFAADSSATKKTESLNNSISDSLPKTIVDIILVGNVLTKPPIILRELTFRKGQAIKPADFEKLFVRSEDNLMNTSLFNSTHITWLVSDTQTVTIYIILKERWYIFPFPIFELVDRNFNEWLRSKDFTKINLHFYNPECC